ncbi:LysR family transcriptional regulator [Bowmanella yangjiangensis]|uniref:LysR family transcriptional regulator n=1 Tax=Bowmanella yangjiangensis TaxID=2811230 RepID=A0ABS3CU98_9ALTE|nr:LysR family transcriptional regulator [Bowmanella yangjiangensis]MBN7820693.1 LysR family transcriptional regulator [Bowmanella yangjiangensis]
MRLRHIEVFHSVYTTGSITGAAKLLFVSQPSVSKVLAHAEMQLGFQLFHRNKGQLIPTPEADMLFSEVDKTYRQLRSIRKMSENIKRNDFGQINLSFTPALGFEVVPKALAKFREEHPNIRFDLETTHNDQALQALTEHRCDLALLYSSPPMPGVTKIECGEGEIVILYPKAQFPDEPKVLSPEQLAKTELIGIWDSGPLGELAYDRLTNDGVQVQSNLQVTSYYVAARMVAQGLGCCTIDKFTALGNLSDKVGMASFAPPLTFKINGLYLDNRPLSKVSEAFLKYLKSEISA